MQSKQSKETVRKFYTEEFRASAVALVVHENKRVAEVARNLGISRSALDKWVQQTRRSAKGEPMTAKNSRASARKFASCEWSEIY